MSICMEPDCPGLSCEGRGPMCSKLLDPPFDIDKVCDALLALFHAGLPVPEKIVLPYSEHSFDFLMQLKSISRPYESTVSREILENGRPVIKLMGVVIEIGSRKI